MSAGGVFKLLMCDGRADRLIHANDLLLTRIKEISCARRAQSMQDTSPTLADIEKTHILFVNAHYKPFAALAYEYSKVSAQSGTVTWGGQVMFSIPSYGEFFSDMVANIRLGSVSCTQSVVPAFPDAITGNIVVSDATHQISDATDAASHTYTRYIQEYVNASGEVQNVGTPIANYVRYCEYPGEMLFREVKFEINGNPLDSYTRECTAIYRKYNIFTDREIGWKRLVGQEVPVEGYTPVSSVAGANAFTAPMSDLLDSHGNLAGVPSASVTSRKMVQVVHGPQTPKIVQPELNLWIPLLFWFNKDIRLAIPSVSIPFGQRFITINLEQQHNVVYRAPGNLFLRLTTETRVDQEVGGATGTAAALDVSHVSRQVNYEPVIVEGSTINPTQTLFAEMYVNNIFVNTEIHDIYIKRVGFTLIRVHRLQREQVTASNANIQLTNLKWPTEYICVGLLPTFNNDSANANKYRDWHNFTRINDETLYNVAHSTGAVVTDNATPFGGATTRTFDHTETTEQVVIPVHIPTIDTIKVTVQGNDIINTIATPFLRDYTPWYYGHQQMRPPVDPGMLMINFAVYPGQYQPSGHVNISRAREFFVSYTSSYCSASTPCEFLALGIAINFLLVSDGSALLRFTA